MDQNNSSNKSAKSRFGRSAPESEQTKSLPQPENGPGGQPGKSRFGSPPKAASSSNPNPSGSQRPHQQRFDQYPPGPPSASPKGQRPAQNQTLPIGAVKSLNMLMALAGTGIARYVLGSAAVIGLVISGMTLLQGGHMASIGNLPLSEKAVGQLGTAATVQVICVKKYQASIPQFQVNADEVNKLRDELARSFPRASSDQVANSTIGIVMRNMGRFYRIAAYKTETLSTGGTGSGFFISGDGYLLTNAHVVKLDSNQIKEKAVKDAMVELIKSLGIAETYLQSWLQEPNNEQLLISNASSLVQDSPKFEEIETKLAVIDTSRTLVTNRSIDEYMRAVINEQELPKGLPILPATVVEGGVGEPEPGKDVAVLKVQGGNFFTLPLADSKAEASDRVTIVGYPGDVNQMADNLDATVTSGKIIKTGSHGGTHFIFFDAAIYHGNSGGPVLNEKGAAVGLATFLLSDIEGKTAVAQHNGGIDISDARAIMLGCNIKPAVSSVTILLRNALANMAANHYGNAVAQFDAILRDRPDDQLILRLKSEAKEAVEKGQDQQ